MGNAAAVVEAALHTYKPNEELVPVTFSRTGGLTRLSHYGVLPVVALCGLNAYVTRSQVLTGDAPTFLIGPKRGGLSEGTLL